MTAVSSDAVLDFVVDASKGSRKVVVLHVGKRKRADNVGEDDQKPTEADSDSGAPALKRNKIAMTDEEVTSGNGVPATSGETATVD